MKNKKGFTLIELMIVITIMAVLATMSFFAFSRVQKQARDAVRKGDIRAVSQAVQAYANDNSGNYPTTALGTAVLTPTYLPRVPTDPSGGAYSYLGTVSTFSICATLEVFVTGLPVWQVSQTYPGGHTVAACVLE
ncbi:MAG: prepilin-type N-terminal cleavage/methylation domain-containing protein [Patescibacteria group bacterium]